MATFVKVFEAESLDKLVYDINYYADYYGKEIVSFSALSPFEAVVLFKKKEEGDE